MRDRLVVVTASAYATPASAGTYVRDAAANHPIFEESYYLSSGTTYEWETTDLRTDSSLGCTTPDTVMRLMSADTFQQVQHYPHTEHARNDDGGSGYASKITYTPSMSGWYKIVVHG